MFVSNFVQEGDQDMEPGIQVLFKFSQPLNDIYPLGGNDPGGFENGYNEKEC
jgi:hypothetical protein